jgi:hypothetical protein
MAQESESNRPRGGRPTGYRVRIVYTEPEFQRRNPHCPPEFSGVFQVSNALSHDDAVRQALAEWNFCIRHSGVAWPRVIKSVIVET